MSLLLPEWQGFGLHADVHRGATALAAELFRGLEFTTIDAPFKEELHVEDDVLGLHSIAPRFERALGVIRAAAPDRLVTIGGTCGVELAPVAYLNERYAGDLTVLWLDAHADLNTPMSSPSGHFHGMVLRALLGDGPESCARLIPRPLTPSQVFLVGVREFDPPEAEYVAHHRIPVLDDGAFAEPSSVIAQLSAKGVRRLYIHFDVDVLDPAGFTGALMRAPGGGPSLAHAASLIRELHAAFDVAGFSVLEYCDRDVSQTQALVEALRPFTRPRG